MSLFLSSKKIVQTGIFVLLTAAVCGCGGGGSSSDAPVTGSAATRLVAGFVEDGPIVDARVYLVNAGDESVAQLCGASGVGRCETRSDDAGHFTFLLEKSVDPQGLLVLARGGDDGNTGLDFSDLEQCTALDFFASSLEQVVVSPLTTLVTRGWQTGATLEDSLLQVAANLQLSGAPERLLLRPGSDVDLQNRTLLLSKLALELALKSPEQDPLALLAATLSAPRPTLFNLSFPDPTLLADLDLGIDTQQRVEFLRQQLSAWPNQQEIAFVEEELFQGITAIAERSLAGSSFNPLDPAFISNGHSLARQLRQALAPALVPLNGIAPQRLARYLLHAYGLNDAAVLALPTAAFDLKLQGDPGLELPALASNSLLAELAGLTSVYSVKVPLLADEIPGDDSALRADYYYRSDASHLHQTEDLIGLVSDDAINDPLMVEIVGGKAAAGLFAEAEKIVQTQIYQSAEQADAWLELGRSEVDFGLNTDALAHLDAAYAAIRKVVDNKGATQLTSHDSLTLSAIATNYRKAGYLSEALQVLDYLQQLATVIPSTTSYGKFFVGLRNIAEDSLAAGAQVEAAKLVDDLLPLARLTPVNVKTKNGINYQYFQLRVFALLEVMRLNAELGRSAEVFQLYQEIQSLRVNDGLQNLTQNETWLYAAKMVEELYRSGYPVEALAVANSIPGSYLNYSGSTRSGTYYQNLAFMSVATWEALNNGYSSGYAALTAHFSAVTDLVEGLTYYASNQQAERMAMALINAGRLAEAIEALDEASRLLDGLTETTDKNIYRNLIERGYVKVADLYVRSGDALAAAGLLVKAEDELSLIVAAGYRVDGLVSIALGYAGLGMDGDRDRLFAQAYAEAQAAEPLVSRLEAAQLYQALAEGLAASGERGGLLSQVAGTLAATAADIHDPVRDAGATQSDTLVKNEIKYLLLAARYFDLMKDEASSLAVLQTAQESAAQVLVDTTRMAQLVDVASALAGAGFTSEAVQMAVGLPFLSSRNEALQGIAQSFSLRDDFPDQDVASIDTDGDGLPNFWSPLASPEEIAASGLTLDPDSDNDGIPDVSDHRPLFVDP